MLLGGALMAWGCAQAPDDTQKAEPAVYKTSAAQRAQRRAYDGAPAVIPHPTFSANCLECHSSVGVAVPGIGFAPPSPHGDTTGMSAVSRCRQCHVEQRTRRVFKNNHFEGLQQDLRRGRRFSTGSPPVLPHPVFMRENCAACHSGPAAREEIRTSHPERVRCRQCHAEQRATSDFKRG